MRIGICDDNKADCYEAKEILGHCDMVRTEEFPIACLSPDDVVLDLEEGLFACDLMVLDIEFENEKYNGIRLAKRINQIAPLCQIIYLTDFLEFAPEVYETEHCYFVLKKNMKVMLPLAFEKAYRLYERDKRQMFIELVSEGKKHYLPIHEIIYMEKEGRRLRIYTIHGDYYCYESLAAAVKRCGGELVRCHGSYIINLHYVKYYGREKLTLANGMQIPIGRTYQEQMKAAYLNYWVDRI